MPLEGSDVVGQFQELWPEFLQNRLQSEEWENWALGRQPLPTIPDTATFEYRELQSKSVTPWLGLLVQSLSQALDTDGYRTASGEDSAMWAAWQANRMDSEQTSLYEAALTTGVSYLTVLPTSRSAIPEWRPYSSAQMTAFYESPFDEWPAFAVFAEQLPKWQRPNSEEAWRVMLLDDENVHWLRQTRRSNTLPDQAEWAADVRETRRHGQRVCPVIRYVNRHTLKGRAIGEVEPYTAAASRIDQDVFDRLVVQRFASWKVRYATGLVNPLTSQDLDEDEKEAAAQAQEIMLKVGDILTSDSTDTKFGTLDASDMAGHLKAAMEDVRMLASVSQTPPQLLTGDINNVAAEALVAIEASFNRKVEQRKQSFGESHEQAFELTARIMGIEPDNTAQVIWKDMESRSLAQTADALGKVAQMLEVPPVVLWDKLPFLTDQDRERATRIRDREDALGRLFEGLDSVGVDE